MTLADEIRRYARETGYAEQWATQVEALVEQNRQITVALSAINVTASTALKALQAKPSPDKAETPPVLFSGRPTKGE